MSIITHSQSNMDIYLSASHTLECPICAFLGMQLPNLSDGAQSATLFSAEDNVPCLQEKERRFARAYHHGDGQLCLSRYALKLC